MTGRRRTPLLGVLARVGMEVRVNPIVGQVSARLIRRVFRTAVGDWAVELELDGKAEVEIFDHHPTVAMMRALRAAGADIADEVLDQGAEGDDIRSHARRTRD